MGLVTGITKTIDVPNDPGQKIVIRKLGWVALEKSKRARLLAIIEIAKQTADLQAQVARFDAAAAAKELEADPLTEHDRRTLLVEGVQSWTYDGEVDADALDEPTAEHVAREILALATIPFATGS